MGTAVRRRGATVPDLVVLSFLRDRPMHGYALNCELVRCEVGDWAGISRPQVYYSIKKLLDRGWLEPRQPDGPAAGPERQVVATSEAGTKVLTDALADASWARQRTVPPFLTWMALSAHARLEDRRQVVAARRIYLEAELAKERATVVAIEAEGGAAARTALLMVGLVIRQFELELTWLDEVTGALT